jgi:hypothetical protein
MKTKNKKVILSLLFSIVITYNVNAIDLYTPNNSIVYAFTNTEMSTSDIAYYTNQYANAFPQAVVLANASNRYNCHSYAWNLSAGGTIVCWLNQSPDLHKYWDDGSYLLTTENAAEKIFYYNGDHSAIKSSTHSGKYESKWGAVPLMRHDPGYGPSAYQMADRRYYARNIYNISITGSTSICNYNSTYTIVNKPANATVTWSCSSNLTRSTTNGTTSNSAGFNTNGNVHTNYGNLSAWVQAVVNINGINYTLPQFSATIYDFAGLLTTGGQSRTLPVYGTGPSLISTGTTTVTLNSLPNATFSWSLGPSSPSLSWSSSGGTLTFYTSSSTAVYHFMVTMQSSICGTRTAHYYFSADPNVTFARSSYNPQSDLLIVDFADELQATTASEPLTKKTTTTRSYIVRLYDFYGSLLKQGSSAGESISWNLSGQANGIYIVNIYDANTNSLLQAIKFIKK